MYIRINLDGHDHGQVSLYQLVYLDWPAYMRIEQTMFCAYSSAW
jgi:hypothetical protein